MSMVKQLSVFLENKEGRLADVTRALAESGINIRALSIADTTDFGILRLIVDDPEWANKVLSQSGFTVSIREVLAVGVPDKPGGLASVTECLYAAGVVVEYMYAFLGKNGDHALVLLKVSDSEKALKALAAGNIEVIGDEIYRF